MRALLHNCFAFFSSLLSAVAASIAPSLSRAAHPGRRLTTASALSLRVTSLRQFQYIPKVRLGRVVCIDCQEMSLLCYTWTFQRNHIQIIAHLLE